MIPAKKNFFGRADKKSFYDAFNEDVIETWVFGGNVKNNWLNSDYWRKK